LNANGRPLSFGVKHIGSQVNDFVGELRDVALYDRAVSASEAGELTNEDPPAAGLVGFWPLDHSDTGTTRDRSTFSAHGTVNGPTVTGAGIVDDSGVLAGTASSYTTTHLLDGEKYEAFVVAETEHTQTEDL
jgi:hypothetical protein